MTCCVGYIGLETKSFVRPGGYNQNYSAHLITPAVTASHLSSACNKDLQGTKVLFSGGQPGGIRLPVPASVRRVEEEKKQKVAQALTKLEAAGVPLASIPKDELENGEGEVRWEWVGGVGDEWLDAADNRCSRSVDQSAEILSWEWESGPCRSAGGPKGPGDDAPRPHEL